MLFCLLFVVSGFVLLICAAVVCGCCFCLSLILSRFHVVALVLYVVFVRSSLWFVRSCWLQFVVGCCGCLWLLLLVGVVICWLMFAVVAFGVRHVFLWV